MRRVCDDDVLWPGDGGHVDSLRMVVVALGFLARTTAMPGDSWRRESVLIPHFMLVEAWTVDTGQALWQRIMDIGTD